MALCTYSLLMLLLITTSWKWNIGCFRAAVRTDSMRWKRISGNTTEASFCFNFQGHAGLQFPGHRRNCSQRKAHWKHTSRVCPSNLQKQMLFRGIAVMPLSHKTLPFEGNIWESKSLPSQAFWRGGGPRAQTAVRAVAPWHAVCWSHSPCPSVRQSISLP